MITSFERSAVAAGLTLLVAVLAGCGGDDQNTAAGGASATPAWESTVGTDLSAAPSDDVTGPTATEPGETPADGGQPQPPAAEGELPPAGEAPSADTSGETTGDEGADASEQDPGGQAPDDPADPAAQPIDACALAAEAIAGVLGASPAPEDVSDPEAFGPGCAWTGAEGHELVVSVSTFDDWVSMDAMLGGDAEEVPDLGTEAWASLSAPSNLQVAWRRDDVSVAVAASLASGGAEMLDVAAAIDAALQAAGY